MKKCTQCGADKALNEFAWRSKKNGTRHSYCKKCRRNADNLKWKTGALKESNYASKQKIRERNRDYVWNILVNSCCMDCGESNPIVLDFDHIGDDKENNIAHLIQRRATLRALQAEIDKCEIVCSNCHRIRTSRRGNHWRTSRFDSDHAALA